jgi:hypothetical protein
MFIIINEYQYKICVIICLLKTSTSLQTELAAVTAGGETMSEGLTD